MPDIDAFELRFAAAYRHYLEEAETEVDAAGIARSVAGGDALRRAGTWGWPHRAAPAGAWLLAVVALVAAALAGAYILGMRPPMLTVAPVVSEPPSPGPSGLVGLTGTWSSADEAATTLALHPCGPGEVCGRFVVTVDNGTGPRCVYTLEHRPADGDDYVYWTAEANDLAGIDGFHCAYDYGHVELRVRPAGDVSAVVWQEANGAPKHLWKLAWTSDQFEPQLPPTIAGEWSSIGKREVLRLTPCGPGESCGSLTLQRDGTECSYPLQYRPKGAGAYEEYVFWVAPASGAACDASGWSQTTFVVRPVAVGQVLMSHSQVETFRLYEYGFEPGTTPSPPVGG